MSATRLQIPEETAAVLLFRSDRTCCVCQDRGRRVQIHHIDENPSNNDPSNLSVLCFECHGDTQTRGGFGRKLDARQVIEYRDDWFLRVQKRRDAADDIWAAHHGAPLKVRTQTKSECRTELPNPRKLTNYIRTLPAMRREAYRRAQSLWDSGGRQNMKEGTFDVTDVLEQVLITLASWYPPLHFDGKEPWDYINAMKASRFEWHWAHRYPLGFNGWGGSVIMIEAAGSVLDDLETMVVDMVFALSLHLDLNFKEWNGEWDSAYESKGQVS